MAQGIYLRGFSCLGDYRHFDHDGVIPSGDGNDHLRGLNRNRYGSHIAAPFLAVRSASGWLFSLAELFGSSVAGFGGTGFGFTTAFFFKDPASAERPPY
jgi:hypothetical protein